MKFDDPKVTAYALGELENAEDRAQVESLMQRRPEASAEFEEILSLAAMLRGEFREETEAGLTAEQHAEILAEAERSGVIAFPAGAAAGAAAPSSASRCEARRRTWISTAIAASVMVCATLVLLREARRPAHPPSSATQLAEAKEPAAESGNVELRASAARSDGDSETSILKRDLTAHIPDAGHPSASDPNRSLSKAPQPPSAVVWKMTRAVHPRPPEPFLWSSPAQPHENDAAMMQGGSGDGGAFSGDLSGSAGRSALQLLNPSERQRESLAGSASWELAISAQPSALQSLFGVHAEQRIEQVQTVAQHPAEEEFQPDAGDADVPGASGVVEHPFLGVRENPLSAFPLHAEGVAYAMVRQCLEANTLPPSRAVRIEQLVNAFHYADPAPQQDDPMSMSLEVATCPWTPEHRLLRIVLKTRERSSLTARSSSASAGGSTAIATHVKAQVEFNPAQVGAYRLIGCEGMAAVGGRDADSSALPAGRAITALYEIVPAGGSLLRRGAGEALRYQRGAEIVAVKAADTVGAAVRPIRGPKEAGDLTKELLTVTLRWKAPDTGQSVLREYPLTDSGKTWQASSADFHWAAAVASFGLLLRDSPHKGSATWNLTRELASGGKDGKFRDERQEFLGVIERAKALSPEDRVLRSLHQ